MVVIGGEVVSYERGIPVGFMVLGLGCMVQGLELRVEGESFSARGLGLSVHGYLEKGIQTPMARGRST